MRGGENSNRYPNPNFLLRPVLPPSIVHAVYPAWREKKTQLLIAARAEGASRPRRDENKQIANEETETAQARMQDAPDF